MNIMAKVKYGLLSSLEDDELYWNACRRTCNDEAGAIGLEDSTYMPESQGESGKTIGLHMSSINW